MAERMDLLARIAEKAGVDEVMAEEALANLVGELAVTAREEPRGLDVELPPYFDRYVTTEILHLKEQLGAFRAEMDRRFTEMDTKMDRRFTEMDTKMDQRFTEMDQRFTEVERRFTEVDRRFTEMDARMERRFTEVDAKMDQRFTEMGAKIDQRFTEVDRRFKEVDRRFDRLERWFFAVGVPIILGILTIIVKIFFSVP